MGLRPAKKIDRRVLRELREEAPSYDRIRFFLTAPGADGTPWLRLPRTFDLEDPDEYFQRDVMGRQTRALKRACWGATLRKAPASSEPRKAGADPAPTADVPAAGRHTNGGRDTKVVGSTTSPPEGAPLARPFIGPTLTQGATPPKTHAPKDTRRFPSVVLGRWNSSRLSESGLPERPWNVGKTPSLGPRRSDGNRPAVRFQRGEEARGTTSRSAHRHSP